MGKHKYSKGLGFLHVPHSSISREIETCTIPITWEHWILIVRETYGKTQTFQSYGFLTYFMCGINTYNSENMRKVNSQSKEKIWETHKHFKVKCFWNFSLEAEIQSIPKTWEKWIPIRREKYGKKANIPKCWVSEIFWVKQKSRQCPKYGKSEFP